MRLLWIGALLVALIGGCRRNPPLTAVMATAASPTGGRAVAARELVSRRKAGDHMLDQALDLAFEQLDSIKAGRPAKSTGIVPKSADATAFAGAVLDAVEGLVAQLPLDADREMFWMRVGGLAFAAAEEAHFNGRLAEARSLVFAGATRWQNEPYWVLHSAHDGLASVILAQTGERGLAVQRLEDRTDLNGVAAEVLAMLKRGQ